MTSDQSLIPLLAVQANRDGDVTVVVVAGEVDIATVPHLEQALAEVAGQQPARVVVDLADMGFVDCAGGRVIAQAVSALAAAGIEVTVRSPNRTARVVLDATDVDWVCADGYRAPGATHPGPGSVSRNHTVAP